MSVPILYGRSAQIQTIAITGTQNKASQFPDKQEIACYK